MKNKKLLNITILSLTIFFSACSNKQENIKKPILSQSASEYTILGITEPIIDRQYVPQQQNYIAPNNVVQDIEYISYRQPEPIYSAQNNFVQDIEYISYRQPSYSSYPNSQQTINNIEARAKSFLGTPYVWGATGPSKFDCSGFTQWVYRDSGINIPRVSRDQARVGQFISFNELRRGDMMFFDTHKKRTGKVSHVGIYLGNGNFIHASSAGKKVVIYNFNEKPFYKKRFLWGRRVVKDNFHYASN